MFQTNRHRLLFASFFSFLFMGGLSLASKKSFSCCEKGLQITDALTRDADTVFPNIKSDGSRVFLSYVKEPANPGDLEAELFSKDNNGILTSLQTITYDSNFLFEGAAIAAPDFTNLFLFDSNDATIVPGTIRLRKFDSNLNFISQTTFNDYGGDESLEIGITADGKFIALTYEKDGALGNTFIRIIETQNLQTVATASITGVSNGPRWFSIKQNHCCVPYFAIVASDFATFSTLHIFKFSNNTLTDVATASLPSFANIPGATRGCCDEALIATGGFAAFTPNAPSLFSAAFVAGNQTFIPNDTDNLRLYSFADDNLKLVYSETLPSSASLIIDFHPNNKCLLVGQTPVGSLTTGYIAQLRCVQACEKDRNGQTVSADASISSAHSTLLLPFFDIFSPNSFSTDGNWLVTGGSSSTALCGDVNRHVRNVNVYKVTQLCPPCKN